MTQAKRTIYHVKVVGYPGRGGRTYDKASAERMRDALRRAGYKNVRIVEKKQ